MIEYIPYPRHEAKLPVVLSPAEVAAVFEATHNLKHRTILMTIYAGGLRVSEVTHLRVSDIDSQRQVICVHQGKGHKDRQVMLSPKLLEVLRIYWKSYRPTVGLFPDGSPERPVSSETVWRVCRQAGDEATLPINEKGNRHRTIGIHFAAGEAIAEYLGKAGLESGPIFRARRAPHSDELGDKPMSEASMYRVIAGYVAKLPGAVKEGARLYSTHSLRATTATLLLDAGVDIRKVQELLGHRGITTTQIYDKRRRTTKESASHDVPI